MQIELKNEIVAAAKAYIAEKGISNADLGKLAQVNDSYLSHMLRNIYTMDVNGKPTEIHERWFKKLANTIGYSLETLRWHTVSTPQFIEIISALENAKKNHICGMLICETGSGKTYAINRFKQSNPVHTYVITASDMHTMPAILEDLLEELGLNGKWRSKDKVKLIADNVKKWHGQGEDVSIIIDEAENLKIGVIRLLKAMYDAVADHCSIMLVGTPELDDKLERMKKHQREGVPQFCRRFKAGTRYISPINKNYDSMIQKYVSDAGLIKLLYSLSDNYGELHDWLWPVMRAAEQDKKPLTEEYFRIYHNMPKLSNINKHTKK